MLFAKLRAPVLRCLAGGALEKLLKGLSATRITERAIGLEQRLSQPPLARVVRSDVLLQR